MNLKQIQLEVDTSINANYPDNVEVEGKCLLYRIKHLEKTLEQRRKKKWKKFSNHVDYGYFQSNDMAQLQTTGGIIEELNQEKITVNVDSLEGVEGETAYAKVPSKVDTNSVVTNSKPKNTNKDKIMEPNICKANFSLCGDN